MNYVPKEIDHLFLNGITIKNNKDNNKINIGFPAWGITFTLFWEPALEYAPSPIFMPFAPERAKLEAVSSNSPSNSPSKSSSKSSSSSL